MHSCRRIRHLLRVILILHDAVRRSRHGVHHLLVGCRHSLAPPKLIRYGAATHTSHNHTLRTRARERKRTTTQTTKLFLVTRLGLVCLSPPPPPPGRTAAALQPRRHRVISPDPWSPLRPVSRNHHPVVRESCTKGDLTPSCSAVGCSFV